MKLPQYDNKPFKSPVIAAKASQGRIGLIASQSRNFSPNTAGITSSQEDNNKRPSSNFEASQSTKKSTNVIRYYYTTYRKRTTKKNKTWDGDGICLELSSGGLRFYKENGQFMGSGNATSESEKYDKIFSCAGCEIQLDHHVSEELEITRLAALVGKSKDSSDSPNSSSRQNSLSPLPTRVKAPALQIPKFKCAASKQTQQTSSTTLASKTKATTFSPLFDHAKIENVLVMNRFDGAEVDVVVDPVLSRHLRPHQRVGVKFMYDCVMGLSRPADYEDDGETVSRLDKTDEVNGCLLADEMGLGKTLMTITLIWALLKQTPLPSKVVSNTSGSPHQGVFNKVLIVCPVTLIGNWKREFQKWLNLNRIGVLTLSAKSTPDKDKLDVRNFLKVQRSYQVLIIGYEKLLTVSDTLVECRSNIGLLVCDEGHRLKNEQSKTLNVLKALDIPRKILLTGTPIQNDLTEFFTILNFINDGILGSFAKFKRDFINPIMMSRDINNRFNNMVQEKGDIRSQELIALTKTFILRRTSDTIAKFLPPKTDIILFCKPTLNQHRAFQEVLDSTRFLNLSNMTYSSSLGLITLFKKICNSPSLVSQDPFYLEKVKSNVSLTSILDSDSGKLKVLLNILEGIAKSPSKEKVVIVSNYTQTLDIIQHLLNKRNYSNIRLDGSTPSKERDKIVNMFNSMPSIFTFLLSAKSGGVGLNLIGASRLVLFDNDWNPAIDHQAMSRIHRDGQEKPCFIYRLLSTGCIDEKIFQRQLMKNSLSAKFMGGPENLSSEKSNDDLFAIEDLKDLFTVLTVTPSNTHDLICECQGDGQEDGQGEVELSKAVDQQGHAENVRSSQSEGWINAMQLQSTLEKAQEENEFLKARVVRECLAGYRHINPQNSLYHNEDLAIDWNTDVTFAFLKEYNI
ncbi:LAME_0E02652g1_1 [Lachancea meyersii CBS 8951]|uniref:DNA repair and recombination protein RDH54 n=1 Tax=Lachancea meyersii CBS 8951 TaxID=1266667 RepID=A0A1G4JG76_9SACH|nr:LAME_0E02652g1_1 [Lachancea meyersii CBS 8951]